jgi:UDP-glucuronate decarboxylase
MTFSWRRVLLTGGAGFIGSHLLESLLQNEEVEEIVVVDSLITGQRRNIEPFLSHPRLSFIEQDLTNEVWLGNFLQENVTSPFTMIFHFASPASPPRYQAHPVLTYAVNAFVTHSLVEYASQVGARLLFASTSEVYGDPLVSPQPESYWGNVNPNGIRACYDESKRLGETVCGVWYRQTKADIRIVRIFNTYGPRMDIDDGRVIPSFFQAILKGEKLKFFGTGEQTRSFCYVKDLVRGLLTYAKLDGLAGETINLGNPDEYTMIELAGEMEKLLGHSIERELAPLPADDPTQRRPDISKAQKLLQWQPEVKLQDGLRKTYEYFSQSAQEPDVA